MSSLTIWLWKVASHNGNRFGVPGNRCVGPVVRRALRSNRYCDWCGPFFEGFAPVGSVADHMELWIHVAKLLRAHGGCLGVRRLRRAWKTAISPGKLSNER